MAIDSIKGDGRFVTLESPCFYCKFLRALGDQDSSDRWTCLAYPGGIPYGIWGRHINHNQILPGQEGTYVYTSKVFDTDDGKQQITFDGDWIPAESANG